MKKEFVQIENDIEVNHGLCEYVIYDINDIGNNEVLACVKIVNEVGVNVGLMAFSFSKNNNAEKEANEHLYKIVK